MAIASLPQLYHELKRRKVFRVGLGYAVAAWIVIEVADTVFPILMLPPWLVPAVTVLALLGLPLAVVLAWAFEMTPDGPRRADPPSDGGGGGAQPEPVSEMSGDPVLAGAGSRPPSTGRARTAGILGLAIVVVFVAFGAYSYVASRGGPPDRLDRSIAVLPLANMSPDPDNAYLASGVHDEILTQLSKIEALRVISRTSVLRYRDTEKPIGEIGRELGVSAILEGSVQRYGDAIRVTVQLIDAQTEGHLWAERYDRQINDVFAIQTDIATEIAHALHATLTPDERARIERIPTEHPEAYQLFLRALVYVEDSGSDLAKIPPAIRLLERALEIDPSFALASAYLSRMYSHQYWLDGDPADLEAAAAAVESALRLEPDLPQAHLAMGYLHYHGYRDYGPAEREFKIALRGLPNNAEAHAALAYMMRRQGRWDEAGEQMKRAAELDPLRPDHAHYLGQIYEAVRRYPEAVRQFDRAIELAPDILGYRRSRANLYVKWKGDLDPLRVLAARDDGERWPEIYLARLERRFVDLLGLLSVNGQTCADPESSGVGVAGLHMRLGNLSMADRCERMLERRVAAMDPDQNSANLRQIALIKAYLGQREEALEAAYRVLETYPPDWDSLEHSAAIGNLASVYMLLEDADSAVAYLDRSLSIPAGLSPHELRLDPWWDALRDHPGFTRLVEGTQ
jgi:TolB-like protein